jgi:hypothetical protein
MTEEQWLCATTPALMLGHLSALLNARRWRLLGCAALRDPKVWPLLVSKSSRRGVEESEAFADGATSAADLSRALKSAYRAFHGPRRSERQHQAAVLAHNLCWQDTQLLRDGLFVYGASRSIVPVAVIREVAGNPFCPDSAGC